VIDLERVHAVANLVDLVKHDVDLHAVGKELHGACPFCACSHTSSRHRCNRFRLNAARDRWYCRHCSPRGGDAIAYVQQRFPDLDFPRACLVVAGHAVIEPRPPAPLRAGPTQPKPPSRLQPRPLADNNDAKNYVLGRGIPLELATSAGVGWTVRRNGRLYVAFPFTSQPGQTVAWDLRAVDPRAELPHDADGPKGDGIFFASPLEHAPVVAITEAPFDALSLAVAGIPSLALGGCGYGPPFLEALVEGHNVLIATDADEAGDQAAARLSERLGPIHVSFARARPPDGLDWNDVLCTSSPVALRATLCLWLPPTTSSLSSNRQIAPSTPQESLP